MARPTTPRAWRRAPARRPRRRSRSSTESRSAITTLVSDAGCALRCARPTSIEHRETTRVRLPAVIAVPASWRVRGVAHRRGVRRMSRSRVPVRRASAIAVARVVEPAGAEIRPRQRVRGEDVATFGEGRFRQSNGLFGTAMRGRPGIVRAARARACRSATPLRPAGSCRSASSGRPSFARRSPASAKSAGDR